MAVVSVIVFHAEWAVAGRPLLPGGYLGVDVFFVISGYLITGLILADLRAGTFSLTRFYRRRARRILPALFAVLIVSAPVAWVLMTPEALMAFSGAFLSTLVFASNFWFWAENPYWAEASALKPLLHTWSLAIEEQFYVLFPLVLMVLFRARPDRLTMFLAAFLVLSLLAAEGLSHGFPDAAFYSPLSRAWELLVGAVLAVWETEERTTRTRPAANGSLALIGLICVVVPLCLFDESVRHPSLVTAVPVVGTALLIRYARPGTVVGNILSVRPFVAVGLISYSLYLWHYPVFAFARIKDPTPSDFDKLEHLAIVVGLAVLSFFLIERPCREGAKGVLFRIPGRAVFAGLAAVAVGGAAFVGAVHQTQGFAENFAERFPLYRASVLFRDHDPYRLHDDGACQFHARALDDGMRQRFRSCSESHGKATVIVGDSHAMDLYNALSLHMNDAFIVGVSEAGCRLSPAADCFLTGLGDFLAGNREHVGRVIFEQAGSYLFQAPDGQEPGRALFRSGRVPALAVDEEGIRRAFGYLTRLAAGPEVIWFGPRPAPHVRVKDILREGCQRPIQGDPSVARALARLDRSIAGMAEHHPRVTYISQIDALGLDPREDLYDCEAGAVYWSDGDHFSIAGERRFGARLVGPLLGQKSRP